MAPKKRKICGKCRKRTTKFGASSGSPDGLQRWCLSCSRESCNASLQRLRLEVITGYGGKCVVCAEDDPDLLCLDHFYNDGAAHRKLKTARGIWKEVRDAGFPDGFQILCRNHNWQKHLEDLRSGKGT